MVQCQILERDTLPLLFLICSARALDFRLSLMLQSLTGAMTLISYGWKCCLMTMLMQLCMQVMVVLQEQLYLLPCSVDGCPLQVNHILHEGSAASNILSAVLDLGDFLFLISC